MYHLTSVLGEAGLRRWGEEDRSRKRGREKEREGEWTGELREGVRAKKTIQKAKLKKNVTKMFQPQL